MSVCRADEYLSHTLPPLVTMSGDAKLKVTATAAGGQVLIPDPEVTTFRPCGSLDDFIIIGDVAVSCVISNYSPLISPIIQCVN